MAAFLHGVHVPHKKHTSGMGAEKMPPPHSVTIPTAMHIGRPANPVVKAGDCVKVGTLIAQQNGYISSPVYSSVSGRVTKIADFLTSGGAIVPAVTIESDGLMIPDESLSPKNITSREALIDAIRESGIVGLGGAGFPTYVKFNAEPEKIDEIIVNGAECEPYITSDSYTMEFRADDIAHALGLLERFLGVKRIIIAIESNKKAAIESMRSLSENDKHITVKVLPSIYPQGGEKVLVYHTTGKMIPQGRLPIDVGCIVCNATTVAAIGSFLHTGMPLVEKCVTVDGEAVRNPKNVIAPIGTAVSDLFDFCGGLTCEPEKVLCGGPMMGITVPSLTYPVIKNTNAVLALSKKEAKLPRATACIRCGSCVNTCPFRLRPTDIATAYGKKDTNALINLNVNLCMECGCCSFVCPARHPLVQTNKLAKAMLRDAADREKTKDGAK